MAGSLHIDGRIVNGEPDRLRRVIATHIESEEVAARLFAEIVSARFSGDVDHVTLVPDGVEAEPARRSWKLRIRHNAVPI